jgi:ornithine cyclodeaminase/alanine dehydrogenase-like protein (mu-crystallin family)
MDALVLNARAVAELLDEAACIAAVEGAFRALGEDRVGPPAICGVHVPGGGFHVKAGTLEHEGRLYFAAKTNANFPGNPALGLPTIQGLVLLFDATRGRPLAILDSGALTALRTAAATAVAARYLARPDSAVAAIHGCGVQGRAQLRALCHVLPIERVYAVDADPEAAKRLPGEMAAVDVHRVAVGDTTAHKAQIDVFVTCTPARAAILGPDDVTPGSFVAGVGADSEEKHELSPELLLRGTLVVDVLEQCATIGDLHHAIEAGVLTRDSVHAELGEIVAGRKPGRTSADEITIFDSTGMALQDVAAAAVVYERALDRPRTR